ncbi:MAG: rubredoxin-like domain-containing protein, partial [Bacteroidota bacterium]
ESYERDVMYPEFIEKAKAEKQKDALRSFRYAISAEKEHARLYAEALANGGAATSARPYFVCTVCGYTTTNVDFSKCPSCGRSKDNYVKVS